MSDKEKQLTSSKERRKQNKGRYYYLNFVPAKEKIVMSFFIKQEAALGYNFVQPNVVNENERALMLAYCPVLYFELTFDDILGSENIFDFKRYMLAESKAQYFKNFAKLDRRKQRESVKLMMEDWVPIVDSLIITIKRYKKIRSGITPDTVTVGQRIMYDHEGIPIHPTLEDHSDAIISLESSGVTEIAETDDIRSVQNIISQEINESVRKYVHTSTQNPEDKSDESSLYAANTIIESDDTNNSIFNEILTEIASKREFKVNLGDASFSVDVNSAQMRRIESKTEEHKFRVSHLCTRFVDDISELPETLEYGVYAIFGPARQGKTAYAKWLSTIHNVPYARILEPADDFDSINKQVISLEDVSNALKDLFESENDVFVIDSSRFMNSLTGFGMAPGGTPTIYSVALTQLNNLAYELKKTVFIVVSTITNDVQHITLLREMLIGSCSGVIEPAMGVSGGELTIRGGSRDFIKFVIIDDRFGWKMKSQLLQDKVKSTIENVYNINDNKNTLNI